MATSSSRLSYQDCFDILDAALSNSKGIRVQVSDYGVGNHLRVRLHTARTIDRKDNKEAYQPGHKLFGRSIYDQLVCRYREDDGKCWMYIERFSTDSLNIEPLGEDHVLNEATNGDLREVGGESDPQSGEEAGGPTIDVFDREAEREAELARQTPPPVDVPVYRRRVF